jgi:hypothetical protein
MVFSARALAIRKTGHSLRKATFSAMGGLASSKLTVGCVIKVVRPLKIDYSAAPKTSPQRWPNPSTTTAFFF